MRLVYEDAKRGLFVSTATVSDGIKPHETAIEHPRYRGGKYMIIVEAYDTEEEATAGHDKWLRAVLNDTLPAVIEDCCNNPLALKGREIGMQTRWPREDVQ